MESIAEEMLSKQSEARSGFRQEQFRHQTADRGQTRPTHEVERQDFMRRPEKYTEIHQIFVHSFLPMRCVKKDVFRTSPFHTQVLQTTAMPKFQNQGGTGTANHENSHEHQLIDLI